MADPFASISRRALEKLITRREARLLLDKNVGITNILAYLQSLLQQVSLRQERQEQPFTRTRSISPTFGHDSLLFETSAHLIARFLSHYDQCRGSFFLLLRISCRDWCTTSESMSIILGATGDPGWVNILLRGGGMPACQSQ